MRFYVVVNRIVLSTNALWLVTIDIRWITLDDLNLKTAALSIPILSTLVLIVGTIPIRLPTIVMTHMTILKNKRYKWIHFSQILISLITDGAWLVSIVTFISTLLHYSTILSILSNTQIHNHLDNGYSNWSDTIDNSWIGMAVVW